MIELNRTTEPKAGHTAELPDPAFDAQSIAASGHDEPRSAGPESSSTNDSNGSAAAAGPLQIVQQFLQGGFQSILQLVEIYSDRARLSASRAILRLGLNVIFAVSLLVGLAAAVLVTLRGICGGFVALFGGRIWLGELTGGVFTIVCIAVAIAIGMRMSERRELRRLQAKYEQPQSERPPQNNTPTAEDRTRVPGSSRSSDARGPDHVGPTAG